MWYNVFNGYMVYSKYFRSGIVEDLIRYTCCFFGHREIEETEELRARLHGEIESLILNGKVHTFLFGSKSRFDDLCYEIVSKLKEKYPYLKRIYVRAEFPDINEKYTEYLLGKYEETYFPDKVRGAGKASYIERNFEMIKNSTYCICYYDKNYTVPRKNTKATNLTESQTKSGTAIAYNYAVKKSKIIINMI